MSILRKPIYPRGSYVIVDGDFAGHTPRNFTEEQAQRWATNYYGGVKDFRFVDFPTWWKRNGPAVEKAIEGNKLSFTLFRRLNK